MEKKKIKLSPIYDKLFSDLNQSYNDKAREEIQKNAKRADNDRAM